MRRDKDELFLEIANSISTSSYARRRKVGAIIVKERRIISTGYNGTPAGMNNVCEEIVLEGTAHGDDGLMKTKPEVVHAEMNAIFFAAKHGQSTENCTLYVTIAPCIECSKAIIQSGIKHVVYGEKYRSEKGINLLRKAGVTVIEK